MQFVALTSRLCLVSEAKKLEQIQVVGESLDETANFRPKLSNFEGIIDALKLCSIKPEGDVSSSKWNITERIFFVNISEHANGHHRESLLWILR